MTVTAIIQARLSSSRFPGKVLAPLDGVPMLEVMIDRLARATRIDRVQLATSVEGSDDPLAEAARGWPVGVTRGPLDDVLARFGQAADEAGGETFLRLTGDCPLIDPAVVDALVAFHAAEGSDYASNIDPPTYPDGLDCEVFGRAVLDRALREATTGFEREHVTPWMRDLASGLSRATMRSPQDLSALRLTVDHPEDLDVVATVIARLGRHAPLAEIVELFGSDPSLAARNPFQRNAGSQSPV